MITIDSVTCSSGVLEVVTDIGEPGHLILIPADAVGSRMALYQLASPLEGLVAILREHYARLSNDIETPATRDDAIAQQHGVLADVEIRNLAAVKAALGDNAEQIRAAADARGWTPKERKRRTR